MSSIEVTGLYVYPVKSMRGIALKQATLTPLGLDLDRRWMVVRENGRFVTQRDLPRLALVQTALDSESVVLSAEGHDSIRLPIEDTGGDPVITKVWNDKCDTVDQGMETSRWLTSVLESAESLRLVQMAPGFVRPQSQPENLGQNTTTGFADAAPFLVANDFSLQALNRELLARGHQSVPMNRFRPNIVLQGLEAFAEHHVDEIASGNYRLKFRHPCQRCVVTTIDQDTAVKNPDWQPFKTLREINPMPGNERAPAFAQNATLASGDGKVIAVGDLLAEGAI